MDIVRVTLWYLLGEDQISPFKYMSDQDILFYLIYLSVTDLFVVTLLYLFGEDYSK